MSFQEEIPGQTELFHYRDSDEVQEDVWILSEDFQEALWIRHQNLGFEDYPDGTNFELFMEDAEFFKLRVNIRRQLRVLTWRDLLFEKANVVASCEDEAELQEKLLETLGVLGAWLVALRNRWPDGFKHPRA